MEERMPQNLADSAIFWGQSSHLRISGGDQG